MRTSTARRQWLRGQFRQSLPQRPPWAGDEASFVATCTRCDACIEACPAKVLRRGDGGYPEFTPRGDGCTFCAECVSACTPRALRRDGPEANPWLQHAVIGEGCLASRGVHCMTCADACLVRALRSRPALGGVPKPQIDFGSCSGCGACVSPCPVGAITLVREDGP